MTRWTMALAALLPLVVSVRPVAAQVIYDPGHGPLVFGQGGRAFFWGGNRASAAPSGPRGFTYYHVGGGYQTGLQSGVPWSGGPGGAVTRRSTPPNPVAGATLRAQRLTRAEVLALSDGDRRQYGLPAKSNDFAPVGSRVRARAPRGGRAPDDSPLEFTGAQELVATAAKTNPEKRTVSGRPSTPAPAGPPLRVKQAPPRRAATIGS